MCFTSVGLIWRQVHPHSQERLLTRAAHHTSHTSHTPHITHTCVSFRHDQRLLPSTQHAAGNSRGVLYSNETSRFLSPHLRGACSGLISSMPLMVRSLDGDVTMDGVTAAPVVAGKSSSAEGARSDATVTKNCECKEIKRVADAAITGVCQRLCA